MKRLKLKLFDVTLAMSLIGLAITLASFAFPRFIVGILCFYFGGLWILWTGCFFVKLKHKIMKLALLWAIIDVSILVMFLSITTTIGDVGQSQGTEIVWGIAYLPIIWTSIPFSRVLPSPSIVTDKVFALVQPWTGKAYGGVIADWFTFSLAASIQLSLFIAILWVVNRVQRATTMGGSRSAH
jgi:hypothetical protein